MYFVDIKFLYDLLIKTLEVDGLPVEDEIRQFRQRTVNSITYHPYECTDSGHARTSTTVLNPRDGRNVREVCGEEEQSRRRVLPSSVDTTTHLSRNGHSASSCREVVSSI